LSTFGAAGNEENRMLLLRLGSEDCIASIFPWNAKILSKNGKRGALKINQSGAILVNSAMFCRKLESFLNHDSGRKME